jgi:ATP-binding cassette subfamily C (CFTR/MRP) protein 1
MMRGGVMALVMRESLQLDSSTDDGSSAAAITLVNTDCSNMIRSTQTLNELWANCIEIAIAIYILQSEMGVASVMPIALAIGNPFSTFSPLPLYPPPPTCRPRF